MLLDTSYDLTLKWPDLDFEDFSKDVIKGQPLIIVAIARTLMMPTPTVKKMVMDVILMV
jgi:hypothetical protein